MKDKNYRHRPSKNNNTKGGNFHRKFAEQIISAIEHLDLSDVEYESCDDINDDDSKGKKKNDDFTGMCFMASNEIK